MRFAYGNFKTLEDKFLINASINSISFGIARAMYMINEMMNYKHDPDSDDLWSFSADLEETGAAMFLPHAELLDRLNTYKEEHVWVFLDGMKMEEIIMAIKWYKYKLSVDGKNKYDFETIDEKDISFLPKGVMIDSDGSRFVWCYSKNMLTGYDLSDMTLED